MVDKSILRTIIDNWYNRSKDEKIDEFDRFISLWISFNAWGYHEIETDKDRQMIDDLKKNQKMLESYDKAKLDKQFMKKLHDISNDKIKTYKPKPEYVWLDNDKSLNTLLEMIYKIRCNLFHGRKDRNTERDKNLVKWARIVLTCIFDHLKDRDDFLANST